MEPKEIFFITGEPSGDLHGALLAEALLRRGDYRFSGAGGELMRRAGVRTDFDTRGWAVMGLAQALAKIPAGLLARRRILQLLRERRPALLVLIDFGGFNVNIANCVRQFDWHLPILYFFPPKSWDKRERDRSRLAALTDAIATPFEWSARLLCQDGANARWVGHPVVDRITPAEDQAALRRSLGLPEASQVVGLMAGSRRGERALLGPQLLGAAQLLREDADRHFLWSPGPPGTQDRVRIPEQLRPHLTVIEHTADLLRASDLTLMSFGTTTLEATAALAPCIGMYRGTPLQVLQFRLMKIPTKYFAMPNIILETEAVPELLMGECDAAPLAARARELLRDSAALARMRSALADARAQLGPPGAIERTADLVEETIAAAEAKH